MVKATACKSQAGTNILKFKIRQFLKNLLGRKTVGEKVQHVGNPNPHTTYAGSPSALLRVHCDPICKFNQFQVLLGSKCTTGHLLCLTIK